ncbi:Fc.00g084370.m01.CDS01 [Cosmosporella sp. VM-42]
MADKSGMERLTPLDLLMPRIFVLVTLTFRTTKSTTSIAEHLQPSLDALAKQLPWLAGRVFLTPSVQGKPPTPEIRWHSGDAAPKLVDKGSIEASYQTAFAKGMPLSALPTDTWPVPSMLDDSDEATGAPVFAASLFRFADNQGVGLCVAIHHHAIDATAMGEIIRLWARNAAESASTCFISPGADRSHQLREALSAALPVASSQSIDEIYASHPEYSRVPPTLPAKFPSYTFGLFRVPMKRILEHKNLLKNHMSSPPTTNTVICALMWSSITNARMKRDSTLAAKNCKLTLAVNTRPRIKENFSTSQNPYFGNTVLCAQSQLSGTDLCQEASDNHTPALVNICEAIGASTKKVDSRYVAEVYSLVERTEDYRSIYAGWDLFGARDLTITSWASLDLYETNFGIELGKPEFVRVPPSEIGGICGILPRRRLATDAAGSDEVLEAIITLHEDDMIALERDTTWRSFATKV